MCGSAGIVLNSSHSVTDLAERLNAMRDSMTHRGPDDAGSYVAPDGRVGLANRRLAIRDLSPAGHMPMLNAAGQLAITYNGELYNAGELRAELERAGHAFRSSSDTEIILRGYEIWGERVVERLRGIFAIAIYDGRRLWLARDQLGIKPLYFAQVPEGFLFASELKALLASGLMSRELNPTALVAYLQLGSVPCPLTVYRQAQMLEPACALSLALGSRVTASEPSRYWDFPAPLDPPIEAGAAVEQAMQSVRRSRRAIGEAGRTRWTLANAAIHQAAFEFLILLHARHS